MKEVVSLLTQQALTTSGTGAAVDVPLGADTIAVQIVCSPITGTTPSATFAVQWSEDGVTWFDEELSAGVYAGPFTAFTAAGGRVKSFSPKGSRMRLLWTISGTTPSFTTKATAVAFGPPN